MTRIIDTINKIMNAQELQKFQVTMSAQTHQVEGKVKYPPALLTDRGQRSWDDYTFRKIKHVEPTNLMEDRWCFIYSDQDYDRANKCVQMMKDASGSFGIKVEEPFYVEVSHQGG